MSNTWFNLRVLWWHLQCEQGRLFKWSIKRNDFWHDWKKLQANGYVALYDFSPSRIFEPKNYDATP